MTACQTYGNAFGVMCAFIRPDHAGSSRMSSEYF
jgi:hypothetical protein